MHNILYALRTDHRNFTRLLTFLEENLALLCAGQRPDYTALLAAVDYLQSYGDLYHHPKEDLLYEVYLEGDGRQHNAMTCMVEEHHGLRHHTQQLKQALEGLLHDALVSKPVLINQLHAYIAQQRRHLHTEEVEVFPLLQAQLSAAEWSRIEALMPTQADPLFEQLQQHYETLHERLAEPLDLT